MKDRRAEAGSEGEFAFISGSDEEEKTTSMYDFSVKFDGQGYRLDVFVNTNEDPAEIAKRLQKAARGQIKAAVIVAVSKLTPDEVSAFMKAGADVAASGAGREYEIKDDK